MIDSTEKNLYLNDAQFYDLDNREIIKTDIPFFLKRTSSVNGDILELACGTGRITIPLAQSGRTIWGLEYSETMIAQFKLKMEGLPKEVAERIHLFHGDMSNFSLEKKFPLILLPSRSFQLLLDEELENACLKLIHHHLEDQGTFIIDIGNFMGNKKKESTWVNETAVFDWENTDPKTGYKVHRTHIKKEIDTDRQIIYPQKTYRVTKTDGNTETIVKRAPWKYFFEDQVRHLLMANNFKIIEAMGTYDGKPISEETPEFIFICQKK